METRTRLKAWGNSLGVIIPREIIMKNDLKENEEITIKIEKNTNLKNIFGKGKGLKIDSQKMKEEGRKSWKME